MVRPLAVLIVEDSESDAQLIVRTLTKAGYTLTFERVETAAQMRGALEKQLWELVISDFSMPELDGHGALKVLQGTRQDIPFIVVSGTMGEETAVTMMKAGAHDYVMKGNLPRLIPAVERELLQAEVRRGRKQAEENLMDSKVLIDEVVENIPLMIFLKEATDLRFVLFNRAGEDLLGYDRKSLLGKNNLDLFPPKQAAHFMAKDREVLDGEVGFLDIPEEPILTARKGQRLLHTRKVCIRGADGITKYLLGISEDITERKRIEEEIRSLNAELEQRVEERTHELRQAQEQLILKEKLAVLGQLAGGVAHELRNPLGVILNAVYYLKLVQPNADEKINQYHTIIEQEAHHAEKIVVDLLDFARIKFATREPVPVSELVQRVLSRCTCPEFITTALNIPADLPPIFVDPHQMEQVFGNLVLNACQAMESSPSREQAFSAGRSEVGKLTITALRKRNTVSIAVKDTGVGIPPENMPKLFEPLFSTKITGIGLGLAISQKLAEANSGRIEVESEPGKGSTFTVFLPVHKPSKIKPIQSHS